eukprot:353694-Chlamydomonas_euryale.AAC.2
MHGSYSGAVPSCDSQLGDSAKHILTLPARSRCTAHSLQAAGTLHLSKMFCTEHEGRDPVFWVLCGCVDEGHDPVFWMRDVIPCSGAEVAWMVAYLNGVCSFALSMSVGGCACMHVRLHACMVVKSAEQYTFRKNCMVHVLAPDRPM